MDDPSCPWSLAPQHQAAPPAKVFQTPTQRVNNDATSSIQTQLNSKATGTGTANGTNTGDNATNTQYSSLVTNATHTGDATGSTVLTFATVNANAGSFGSASSVPQYTVNAKGLTTASANVPIAIAQSQVANLVNDLASKVTTIGTTGNIQRIVGTNQLGNSALVDNGTSVTSTLPFLSTGSVTGNSFVKAAAGTTNILLAGGADITQLSLPISSATQTALNLKANLASPALTGTPTTPAPTTTTGITNKAYVDGLDAGNVKLTGSQTITGGKTFTGAVFVDNGSLVVSSGVNIQATGTNVPGVSFNGNADNFANSSEPTITRKANKIAILANANGGTQTFMLFDGSLLNISDKTFTFPNQNGTLALTSNPTSITATSFINSTAPAENVLLAGGGTLANPITGTGTANFLPKFTGTGTVGNSIVSDDGTAVMISKTGNASLNIMTNTSGNPSLFLTAGGSDGASIVYDRSTSELRMSNSAATNALRINSAGSATFSSTVTAASFIATTGTVRLKGFTVATLPAGVIGDTAFVTDAVAPSYLVTVMGGGAVATVVFYNGNSWVSH